MSMNNNKKVLTFLIEDLAQTLPYSMAGKPQWMVLQREEKVSNVCITLIYKV